MNKRIDLTRVKLGMARQEVNEAMRKRPDNIIGSKWYGDDLMEVVQYSRWGGYGSSVLMERYWLYFVNDELIQWGRPGDWERESDHIYEVRVK